MNLISQTDLIKQGISRSMLRRWKLQGLNSFKPAGGRKVFFDKDEVEKFIKGKVE